MTGCKLHRWQHHSAALAQIYNLFARDLQGLVIIQANYDSSNGGNTYSLLDFVLAEISSTSDYELRTRYSAANI